MPDRYQQLVGTPVGRILAARVGLPAPPTLRRHRPGRPVIEGPVLLAAPAGGDPGHPPRLGLPIAATLRAIDADTLSPMDATLRTAIADAELPAAIFNPDAAPRDQRFAALVLDATGLARPADLAQAYAFFHDTLRRVAPCGRVIVCGTPPEAAGELDAAVTQRALEGLTRSLAKELRGGATAQLVYVAPGAEAELEATLRFLISPRSAYVDGQVIRVAAAVADPGPVDWTAPLNGRVALVTGAARGIGSAIAEVLAREGAHVVGLDVEPMAEALTALMRSIGGSELVADVTAEEAPALIAERLLADHQGVDVVVHNAGVTRDRTIARMTPEAWSTVMAINLLAPQRITAELLARDVIRPNGRIIGLSSMNGIAGTAGQTNYATTKAGMIGFVQAGAPVLAGRGVTLNCVAPGFIETEMTAAMPFGPREVGRRANSLSQGGLPVDVAETIAWLAWPASAGVTGQAVRVCGQSLIGA